MTKYEMMVEFLLENPVATNQEIAEGLGISDGYAKQLVSTMRKMGIIEVVTAGNDERGFRVFPDKLTPSRRNKVSTKRKDIAERLLDIVFEALEEESQIENVINAGHLIVKLMDRM